MNKVIETIKRERKATTIVGAGIVMAIAAAIITLTTRKHGKKK